MSAKTTLVSATLSATFLIALSPSTSLASHKSIWGNLLNSAVSNAAPAAPNTDNTAPPTDAPPTNQPAGAAPGDWSADAAPTTAPAASNSDVLKMTRFVVHDQQTGLDAYTMLIPTGWQAQGKVIWDTSRVAAPSDLVVQVHNPQGAEQFNRFPAMLFSWSQTEAQTIGVGKKYLGCLVEPPPKNDIAAIERWVIPTYRRNLRRQYRIVSSEQLPKLAAAAAPMYTKPGAPGNVTAAKVRIEYTESGRDIQEDFVVVYLIAQTQGGGSIWGVDQINSFKAEKDQLDTATKPMTVMAMSLKPTLKFEDASSQASQMLMQGQYQNQAAIMQRVQINEQAGQQINQMIMQGYQQRMAVQNQVAESFDSKVIRQVQDRTNPFTGEMEQEPDYSHVWVDQSGNHIYSNSANYNPNGQESGTWQEEPAAN